MRAYPRKRFSSETPPTPITVSTYPDTARDNNLVYRDSAFAASARYGWLIASDTQTSTLLLGLTASHFSKNGATVGLEICVHPCRPICADETVSLEWLVAKVTPNEKRKYEIIELRGGFRVRTARRRRGQRAESWSPIKGTTAQSEYAVGHAFHPNLPGIATRDLFRHLNRTFGRSDGIRTARIESKELDDENYCDHRCGPGGLVAARYLKKAGFAPVIFEQGDAIGGQWNGGAPYSGVWPSMRTNTSRVMTAFSDLQHSPHTPVYPSNQAMYAYLNRYAERFDLMRHVRLKTRVDEIDRDADGRGWGVRFRGNGGVPHTEVYSNVIVASGRYSKPMIPDVPGLRSFSGVGGVAHTFEYKQPERYRGQRVLVAGCSISALIFGPLSPRSFRLSGPDSLPEAVERVAEDAAAFGAVPTPELTPIQRTQLQALAAARKDAAFTQFVDQVTSPEGTCVTT